MRVIDGHSFSSTIVLFFINGEIILSSFFHIHLYFVLTTRNPKS